MELLTSAAKASQSSQHSSPTTDHDPQGRLAPVLTATRAAAAADTRASTGPTPDAVDATSDARRAGPPDAVVEAASGSSATTPAAAATK